LVHKHLQQRDSKIVELIEEGIYEGTEWFYSFVEATDDWVWEIDQKTVYTYVSPQVQDILGYKPEEVLGKTVFDLLPSEEAQRFIEIFCGIFAKHEPFRSVEYTICHRSGELVILEASGVPFFNADGIFCGYRGINRNSTKKTQREKILLKKISYLELLQSVTAAANEALTMENALQVAVDQVCFHTKWPVGHVYIMDKDNKDLMIPTAVWHLENRKRFEALQKATAISNFSRGAGLPGRILASGKPAWIIDVRSDLNFHRTKLVEDLGVKSCFGFPVMIGTSVLAVLEFFSAEMKEPHEQLLEVMSNIGIQLGHVIKRKLSEEALLESEERFRSVAQAANDAIISANTHGNIVSWNRGAQVMFGYSEEEILGKTLTLLMPERFRNAHEEGIKRASKTNERRIIGKTVELFGLRKDGSEFPLELSVSLWETREGKFFSGIIRDITGRKQAEERLQHLAHHDEVTGLANRSMFFERLNQELSRARWHNRLLAVLFLDLDRFKVINDTLGHATGDSLLRAVGKRIKDTAREGDIIARLGGDEFAVMLVDVAEVHDIPTIAKKIIDALNKPFVLEGKDIFVTTSIGIGIFPDDGNEAEVLLQKADIAMYRAKEEGKNTYQIYSPAMNTMALQRLTMETQLRQALERNEFILHYQPKVDLNTGRIIGMEALIRWQHPELGIVSPNEFIPILEETGLILPVGEWVIRTACAQNKAWQENGFTPLRVAVNLSARQLKQQSIVEMAVGVLNETGLHPTYLEMELTENILMEHKRGSIAMMDELNARGIHFAIDDFGTGYSSLSYLRRFTIHSLKIDRSFIQNIATDPDSAVIVKAIIAMAKNLRLKVVAEGVETGEQLEFLLQHKCDEIQGYYFSPPLTVEKFTHLLKEGRCLNLDNLSPRYLLSS